MNARTANAFARFLGVAEYKLSIQAHAQRTHSAECLSSIARLLGVAASKGGF